MYRCPECKSTDLEVDIVTRAVLIQDEDGPETLTDEASCGDHEWDNNSMMYCTECNHSGTAETFETEDDEGDEDEGDEDGECQCGNCELRWKEENLNPIDDLCERVLPGEIMPHGQCPSCGALCHAYEED